jgi:4-hydroxybenzoate polyprenyltransferase/phosphoserine phosphatase
MVNSDRVRSEAGSMRETSFQTKNDRREVAASEVLCVDLDGTIIRGDLLFETVLLLIRQRPAALLLLPFWLLFGRAVLKRRIAERVRFDPRALSYNADVIDYLREQKLEGHTLVLATASDQLVADEVSSHLGLFDLVMASDGATNLKGRAKQRLLAEHFGEKGFDYVGDSASDVSVWRSAAHGVVVSGSKSLQNRARAVCNVTKILEFPSTSRAAAMFRALRLHHWSKNLLLFLPLLLAHKLRDPARITEAIGAFFCFGGAASAIYVLNDLLDLQSDRQHPWKSRRPFASSALSIPFGMVLFVALAAGSFLTSTALLPWKFTLILACYVLLSALYSTLLKTALLVDVMLLASFYAIRIFAGASAVHVRLSYWLIAFAMFFFFSLAMAKRYSELVHAPDLIESGNSGRAYVLEDRAALSSFGISSGYLSVLVIAFYLNSNEVVSLYHRPEVLWLICPLVLYWVSRIWMLAHREMLSDDPVVIAMRDRVSYVVGVLAVLVVLAARPIS